ncbi:flavodoxin [Helicobacter sp. MIT 05-5294]|uniref:flavodoxin n=1 Tax=Helicobacter sp. MIT 05-5294 TaxID=1548150 RepID=UPI00051FA3C5|nr:flavodoxin [Helicobacter sp. MIT 05-5294]TLD89171.1 flavodoxin [Helicobacter sp. MIT 05-5294]
MQKIGLFYGSDGGNTENVAKRIANALGDVEVFDVAKVEKSKLLEYKNLILATPTYGSGDMQGDWEEFLDTLKSEDFSGKVVAFVGLGDQDTYGETFCDGLLPIYEVAHKEGRIVGFTATDGYEYEESKAVVEGQFVGLILDEDNQEELSEQRIQEWTQNLKGQFQ